MLNVFARLRCVTTFSRDNLRACSGFAGDPRSDKAAQLFQPQFPLAYLGGIATALAEQMKLDAQRDALVVKRTRFLERPRSRHDDPPSRRLTGSDRFAIDRDQAWVSHHVRIES
ncbi:hypothetical protein [Sphingomonas sp. Leaf357]|uniref:hypothetical protein n=1 Tax=Sphingomonas sp. Leaf357 TaxID=1736350 RepID=UPI000B076F44|nr:hypothetical protein [Sphingomonas sp. Leaf357]